MLAGGRSCHSCLVPEDLAVSELVPVGGSWHGLLFGNDALGLDPFLTWGFEFEFREIERDYGGTTPGVTVEWAPLDGRSWKHMSDAELTCDAFAGPVEASVYYFAHHRYDSVRLSILDQEGTRVRARARLAGDIDDLGIPELTVEASLSFTGVFVQLPNRPPSVEDAGAALQRFTSIDGLTGVDRGHNYAFVPGH